MQVTVPPQATPSSDELGFPSVATPSPAVTPEHEVGFKPSDRKNMKILSAMQIAIGISCIVIYVVLIALQRGYYSDSFGAGIWCGTLYLIAGSLGVAGARKYKSGLIVSAMAMSILSSMILWAVVVFACMSIAYTVDTIDYRCTSAVNYRIYCYFYNYDAYQLADSLLIILSVVEFIVSIWCTVLCSKALIPNCVQCIVTQQPYLRMLQQQQQQPALFVHPAAPVAAVVPAS